MKKKPRMIRADVENYEEGLKPAPATGKATLLSYKASGWQKESNDPGYPGPKICCSLLQTRQAKQPDCTAPVVWRRVSRPNSRSFSIGYYCDEHLPEEVRSLT